MEIGFDIVKDYKFQNRVTDLNLISILKLNGLYPFPIHKGVIRASQIGQGKGCPVARNRSPGVDSGMFPRCTGIRKTDIGSCASPDNHVVFP